MKNILLVIFATLSVSFAISYLAMANQLKKVSKDLAKLFVDNAVMQEYIDLTKPNGVLPKEEEMVHKENFIKFLSDSRDWAFEYIEEVQNGLSKFISDVDHDINHFDKYGDVISMERPDYAGLKRISAAYKELKQLMPKESEIK